MKKVINLSICLIIMLFILTGCSSNKEVVIKKNLNENVVLSEINNQDLNENMVLENLTSNNLSRNSSDIEGLDFNSNNEMIFVCKEDNGNYSEYTEDILTLRKDGTAELLYTYPGVTMFGTYTYEDDKFIVTYTEEVEEINGNERIPMDIVYTYEIKMGKLYCEESPYYTAIYERSK